MVLTVTPWGSVRTKVIKRFHLFGSVGKNCSIMNKTLPLYSNLVFIHDNVRVASHVGFVTHDGINRLLNHQSSWGGV